MGKHPNWHPRDYKSLDGLKAELDRIEASHHAGTLKTSGGWSVGQIFDHCSKPMKLAFDGFFDEQGKEAFRHVGFLDEKSIIEQLTQMGVEKPGSLSQGS